MNEKFWNKFNNRVLIKMYNTNKGGEETEIETANVDIQQQKKYIKYTSEVD